MEGVRIGQRLVYHASRGTAWFRLYGWGLAWRDTRHGHVLLSTRFRLRPAIHLGPADPRYPGDGRVCAEGKPVRRWVVELLRPNRKG